MDAADSVRGIIAAGGQRDDYVSQIQSLGAAVSSAMREAGQNVDCLAVITDMSGANDKFAAATNVWRQWLNGDA